MITLSVDFIKVLLHYYDKINAMTLIVAYLEDLIATRVFFLRIPYQEGQAGQFHQHFTCKFFV